MLPVSERKAGTGGAASSATELSYEAALRLHGRQRSQPVPLPAPPANPVRRPGLRGEEALKAAPKKDAGSAGARAPQVKAVGPAAPQAGKPAGQEARTFRPAAGKTADATRALQPISQVAEPQMREKPLSVPKPDKGGKPLASASSLRAKPAKGSGGAVAIPAIQGSTRPGPKASRSKNVRRPETGGVSKSRQPSKSSEGASRKNEASEIPGKSRDRFDLHSDEPTPRIGSLERSAAEMEMEYPGSQLELLEPLSQLDQRRTIVSVRLTEGEFACLRDRAEESGISVSAYMRSCVVDADQLRAQVKCALAEMRSMRAPVGAGQIGALSAPSQGAGQSTLRNGNGWFQLVMRPLAFLFAPLFPSRPRA